MRRLAEGLTFAAMLLVMNAASAWDGAVTGVIAGADATDGPGYEFRIDLQGSPQLCGSGSVSWAYVNRESPNYQVYVATLLAAKMAGAQVTVYTTRDAGTGYCRIGYVRVT
ncbi:hypothetical protein JM946_13520 [Steroidobacter sp. S1-65]|uniref:Uncharacterized protein n=2 Tax=Steroidobacter gossypii TaxID=2805490 RepID=A0ABS1WXQ5_9GAMM|nr:hypothetical protein [Steroidobacter gossypii]